MASDRERTLRVTVFYRDEPIGMSDITIHPPFAFGALEPFATYDVLRPVFWEKSRAMRNLGFLPPDGATVGGVDAAGDAAGRAAFARAAAICQQVELRAGDGTGVAIEDLRISDWHEQLVITIFGRVPEDEDGMPARSPLPPHGDSAGNSPAP